MFTLKTAINGVCREIAVIDVVGCPMSLFSNTGYQYGCQPAAFFSNPINPGTYFLELEGFIRLLAMDAMESLIPFMREMN